MSLLSAGAGEEGGGAKDGGQTWPVSARGLKSVGRERGGGKRPELLLLLLLEGERATVN